MRILKWTIVAPVGAVTASALGDGDGLGDALRQGVLVGGLLIAVPVLLIMWLLWGLRD